MVRHDQPVEGPDEPRPDPHARRHLLAPCEAEGMIGPVAGSDEVCVPRAGGVEMAVAPDHSVGKALTDDGRVFAAGYRRLLARDRDVGAERSAPYASAVPAAIAAAPVIQSQFPSLAISLCPPSRSDLMAVDRLASP